MIALPSSTNEEYIFKFGKFKGKSIKDVYLGYIEWLVNTTSDLLLKQKCEEEIKRRNTVGFYKLEMNHHEENKSLSILSQYSESSSTEPNNAQEDDYFDKENILEFTRPVMNKFGKMEKYPRIFLEEKHYYKAEYISDQIKNFLRFDMNINWLKDYVQKEIEIPYVGYMRCKHPARQDPQIILYFEDGIDERKFKQNFSRLTTISNKSNNEQGNLFKKESAFEFTKPITNKFGKMEKYPRIFPNDKDFFKAKAISDQIKDLLEFELGVDWLNDYYLKEKEIPYVGYMDCKHPARQPKEIILYFEDDFCDEEMFRQQFHKFSQQKQQPIPNYDLLKEKSDNIKKYIKDTYSLDWYNDFYMQGKDVNKDYTFIEIDTNLQSKEILIVKKDSPLLLDNSH